MTKSNSGWWRRPAPSTTSREQTGRYDAHGTTFANPPCGSGSSVAFALLLGTAYTLIRLSIPLDPGEGEWLAENAGTVRVALGLIPFAGIAFLWFMGVVRDRIGDYEDRFFSTSSSSS
jgi:hypothetical protein